MRNGKVVPRWTPQEWAGAEPGYPGVPGIPSRVPRSRTFNPFSLSFSLSYSLCLVHAIYQASSVCPCCEPRRFISCTLRTVIEAIALPINYNAPAHPRLTEFNRLAPLNEGFLPLPEPFGNMRYDESTQEAVNVADGQVYFSLLEQKLLRHWTNEKIMGKVFFYFCSKQRIIGKTAMLYSLNSNTVS